MNIDSESKRMGLVTRNMWLSMRITVTVFKNDLSDLIYEDIKPNMNSPIDGIKGEITNEK